MRLRSCPSYNTPQMTLKNPYALLALLSAVPGAYLQLKKSFLRDISEQMVGRGNPVGIGTSTVTLPNRVLAYIFIGKRERWLDLFSPSSAVHGKLLKSDQTAAARIFCWFVLAFCFGVVGLVG